MITNPILPGFNPDPSALHVGESYYIATSTFEWYPGICIYHSWDLTNWTLVATPIKKLSLKGDEDSGGLWAPHLSYNKGLFWLAITDVRSIGKCKDTVNYITNCKTVDGEWTKPKFVNASGFDPSLFHDDDGKSYFVNVLWDYRPSKESFSGIVMQEINLLSGKLIGKRKKIYEGTPLGVAEGPQLFKRNKLYYLVTAAGGTGYGHAGVVARSANLWGPYETDPVFPLITSAGQPQNPLQKSGHICFFTSEDRWYITHLCSRPLSEMGNCVLGRETALQEIIWTDDWPHLANGGKYPQNTLQSPLACRENSVQRRDYSEALHFDTEYWPMALQSLRMPLGKYASLTKRKGWLRLYGHESIVSRHHQALVARRWQSFCFRGETYMEFTSKNYQQMAGIALFYNTSNFFYLYKYADEITEKCFLNILICEHGKLHFEVENIAIENKGIFLAVKVDRTKAQFSYSFDKCCWQNIGGALPAEHLSDDYIKKVSPAFTGAMIALCCQDMDTQNSFADFDYLAYTEDYDGV